MSPVPTLNGVPTLDGEHIQAMAKRCELADRYGPVVSCPEPIPSESLGAEPCIVIGTDVIASSRDHLGVMLHTIAEHPIASTSAAVLCRTSALAADTHARFAMESATYSALQAGPEFNRWLSHRRANIDRAKNTHTIDTHTIDTHTEDDAVVLASRTMSQGHEALQISLNRPKKGNAVDVAMRDAFAETLKFALADPDITEVLLVGNGNHFCTGGDLDGFGSAPSAGEAHIFRLQRSPHRLLAQLRSHLGTRFVTYVHGNAMGSGIEWAAFAGTLLAHTNATFSLPELSLGLVPGAGGTVSVIDRIGYPRTLDLLLTGQKIDAATALLWGLIDGIRESRPLS